MAVPQPPPAADLDPLVTEWDAGRPFWRCHDVRFGSSEFNRTASPGRFRPVRSRGRLVGTLYGAELDAGSIAEHVFRPVPVDAEVRRVRRSRLAPLLLSSLACRRPLRLAALHGNGLRRVGATKAQLIDSDPDEYPTLAPWGQALHDCPAEPDGIIWRSRHFDDSYSFVLFGDRVTRRELEIVEPPLPLGLGRGLDRVTDLAEEAAITLVE
jgi:hypothetical protein